MYQFQFAPTASDDLARLDKKIAKRIFIKIGWLAENFSSIRPEPLSWQWRDMFKLRVDDYRVLYMVDDIDACIIIHYARHRREVYKIK